MYVGNPSAFSHSHGTWATGFLKAIGSRHLYSPNTQDTSSRFVASALLYGNPVVLPVPDIERCDFVLLLGTSPLVSRGSLLSAGNVREKLSGVVSRGGRVVVVDPRRTETARAFEHVAIRPDGDVRGVDRRARGRHPGRRRRRRAWRAEHGRRAHRVGGHRPAHRHSRQSSCAAGTRTARGGGPRRRRRGTTDAGAPQCTSSSTLTGIAIAIGTNAQAHADGILGAAMNFGNSSTAIAMAGGLANTAITFGKSNLTSAATPRKRKRRQILLNGLNRHRRRPRSRPVPRTDRIHQHQDPTADPDRVRIPLPRSTHRPGHARPRRPPTRTTRPKNHPRIQ